MRRVARVALAAMLALAPNLAWAGEPSAHDREEAKRAYTDARKLTKEGKHAEALERYRRAHELAPTPVTRLDYARALAEVGKLVEALGLASSTAGMPVTTTETQKSRTARKEAAELVTSLVARIPTVTIELGAETEPVEVTIDGSTLDATARASGRPLDPGEHVAAARSGSRRVERAFSLAEGEKKSLTLALPPVERPSEPPPAQLPPPLPAPKPAAIVAQPPEAKNEAGLTPAVPVLLTIGGLGLATGVVTGAIALSQASDLIDGCPNDVCPTPLVDELSLHQDLALASTITFVIGGVAAATGIVVWIVDASDDPGSPAVQARWTGNGLALDGTW